jgi:error-prone DNA polymerase
MPRSEHVLQDYQTSRFSLKDHPIHFLRGMYGEMGARNTIRACSAPNGTRVQVAGVVLIRQRPGSANGVCFITMEDEVGVANIVVWPRVFERYRGVVMGARILMVIGRVQSAENVTHIVAEQLIDRTDDLSLLSEDTLRDPLRHALARADEVVRPIQGRKLSPKRESSGARHPRNVRIIPPSRDFH